jgi:hypothetical protein
MALSRLPRQKGAYVLYNEDVGALTWHQRLVIGRLRACSAIEKTVYLVASADHDVYEENYEEATTDVSAVRFCEARWPPPEGLPRARCYRKFGFMEFVDFAVPGPRTMTWCAKFLNRRGGGPRDLLRRWKQVSRMQDNLWGVAEHSLTMQVMEIAGCYDGLDVVNIACLELMIRKAQLGEFSYSEQGPAPPPKSEGEKKKGHGKGSERVGMYDESSIFLGSHKEFGDVMVCPDLLDYVTKEVEREASVMKKQIRKAREERSLLAREK